MTTFGIIGIVGIVIVAFLVTGMILNKSFKDRVADIKADLNAVKTALENLKK